MNDETTQMLEELVEEVKKRTDDESFRIGIDELRGHFVRMNRKWEAYAEIISTTFQQYDAGHIDLLVARDIVVKIAYTMKDDLWTNDTELRRIIDVVYGKDNLDA